MYSTVSWTKGKRSSNLSNYAYSNKTHLLYLQSLFFEIDGGNKFYRGIIRTIRTSASVPRIFPGIVGASCKWSGWRRSDSSACARVGQSELKKRSRVIVVVTSKAYATNFRRLVLGFSEADSCKQIFIFAFCNISKCLYLITSNYKIYTFVHRSKINLFAKKLTIVLTKCWPWVVQDWSIWWTFANIWLYWFNYLPTCQNLTGLTSVTVNFVKKMAKFAEIEQRVTTLCNRKDKHNLQNIVWTLKYVSSRYLQHKRYSE